MITIDTSKPKIQTCAHYAAEFARLNPHATVRYNESSVYVLYDGKIVLVAGWTLFNAFIPTTPYLDVTEYVDRNSLITPAII